MQNVVVGYDGSDEAERALERAGTIGAAGGRVTVVMAVSVGAHLGGRSMGALNEDELAAARTSLEAARGRLASQGVDAHAIEGEGEPAEVITQAAKELGADLVVVGTRGLGAAKRMVLGSVSSKVVHDAPCDVLVVR